MVTLLIFYLFYFTATFSASCLQCCGSIIFSAYRNLYENLLCCVCSYIFVVIMLLLCTVCLLQWAAAVKCLLHKVIFMIFIPLQVLIQYCGVCLFYADETFLMSNSEHPISSLPSSHPVRWVISFFSFVYKKICY